MVAGVVEHPGRERSGEAGRALDRHGQREVARSAEADAVARHDAGCEVDRIARLEVGGAEHVVDAGVVDVAQDGLGALLGEVHRGEPPSDHVATATEQPQEPPDGQAGEDGGDGGGHGQPPAVRPRRDRREHRGRNPDQRQHEDEPAPQRRGHPARAQLLLHDEAERDAEHAEEQQPPRRYLTAGEEEGGHEADETSDGQDRRGEEPPQPSVRGRTEPEQPFAGQVAEQAAERRLDGIRRVDAEIDVVGHHAVRDRTARHRGHGRDVRRQAGIAQRQNRPCTPCGRSMASAGHSHPDAHAAKRTAVDTALTMSSARWIRRGSARRPGPSGSG